MFNQHKGVKAAWIAFAARSLSLPATGRAQEEHAKSFSPQQIQAGSKNYAQRCSPCHGPRMLGHEAFDLRKFPHEQRARFITSVTKSKSSMPPWGGLLTAEDIENLWAYVVAGEKP
jgi:mono/diheme cytochrome c family protein